VAPALGAPGTAEARVAIAGVVSFAWQARAAPRFAWRGQVRAMFVVGFFNSALPFAAFGFAAYALPAAYLATFNALSPLFGVLIARLRFGDAIGSRRMLGIALGLIGVAVLVGLGPVTVDGRALLACGVCIVAAGSYGWAGNYNQSLAMSIAPTTMATGSRLAATIVLLPLVPFRPLRAIPTPAMLGATLILAIACTSIAYLLQFPVDPGPRRDARVDGDVPDPAVRDRLGLGGPR
jgi:drug/metabolite transporter (DMT)-like permease